jgi:hypothetical protein
VGKEFVDGGVRNNQQKHMRLTEEGVPNFCVSAETAHLLG